MELILETLERLKVGRSTTHRNLTLFPLIDDGVTGEASYITLDEALAAHAVKITEIEGGGSVPELVLTNEGDRSVLVMDGEELVGAKQNRVLNLTVLAPPRTQIVIPVSCVEAGRWSSVSRFFETSSQAMYSSGRARKMQQVSCSLRETGQRRSNQSAVWSGIAAKLSSLGARSETAAMADVFERHTGSLGDYASAFTALPGQVGAVFAIGGRIAGADLFDHPETFARTMPKLVRSYALDALDLGTGAGEAPGYDEAEAFLAAVARAPGESFPALGLGEDVRLRGDELTGAALVANGRLVHLSAFRLERDEGDAWDADPARSRTLRRASWRRGVRFRVNRTDDEGVA